MWLCPSALQGPVPGSQGTSLVTGVALALGSSGDGTVTTPEGAQTQWHHCLVLAPEFRAFWKPTSPPWLSFRKSSPVPRPLVRRR